MLLIGHHKITFEFSCSPGVEITGALKNVLAIAAEIIEGMNLGNNIMAALVAQGCSKIHWLITEKAVQASPKNRFAWHMWGVFESNQGNIDQGRKPLKIGHAVNPRDLVLLQTLALLEYRYSTANLARVLFRKAFELDPRHQPVWIAWGWMEWKEGNIDTGRELYQKALSINSASKSAAHCL